MQIWDTAGQERFRSMAPLYYRGAVAAILVFSITDEGSFEKLKEWVRELKLNHPDTPLSPEFIVRTVTEPLDVIKVKGHIGAEEVFDAETTYGRGN